MVMLNTLLLTGALAASPTEVDATPSSISLFKNGFAVVVREAKLGATGHYSIDEMPQAVLGTLWISASREVKLDRVIAGTEESVITRPAASMDEVLAVNVGKRLTFRLNDGRTATGTLLSVQPAICVILREQPNGAKTHWALPKGAIAEVESEGELIYAVKQKATKRTLRFHAQTSGSGSLFLLTLERGASWAPGYAVDITDPKKLRLTAKATLINDTLQMNNLEARLVTGFPNMPFIQWLDPLTSGQSLVDFTNSLMSMGSPADFQRAGGFGGPAGQMMQNRLAEKSFADAFQMSTLPGISAEDLFFYRLPNVTLKPGERGYYVLLVAESEYRHVYEAELPDTIQDTRYVGIEPGQARDVWHSLKFKNTAKQPLTTAAATVMKDGEVLGQDMMMYTSPEAEATVRITKAMDVRLDDDEEEIERLREDLKIRSGHYDKVTLRGEIQIVNRKPEPITLELCKTLTGEVKTAEGAPKITSLAKGLRAVNPRQRLDWKIELKPGEKKALTYTYTVYINN
jgi:hypothetical protein